MRARDEHGRTLGIAGVAALALLVGCAERPEPAAPTPISGPGQVLYLSHCEGCHGVSGEGNERVASSLRRPLPDLTRLWQRYGTPLDRERLSDYIDGRLLLGVHPRGGMPVWGAEFFIDVPQQTPDLERLKAHLIGVLIDHLETLQTRRAS